MTEPKEGEWPPVPVAGQPLIDPDVVKRTDLPDWLAGKAATSLWKARKRLLETIPQDLKAERQTNGFEAMLRMALGHPAPGNPLQHDLDKLKTRLGSPDDTLRGQATKQIETDLHLTVEGFDRLMEIRSSNDQPDLAKKPTAAEWAELFAILTPARKVKHEYPAWAAEETTVGLVYWKAIKARLPRWRASSESRQAWLQALRARSQPPVIDPAVVGADDLRHVTPGDPEFDVWKERNERITVLHKKLKTAREAEDPDTLAGLDQIIRDTLGIEPADWVALDQERQAGHGIEKRLEQLDLVSGAFTYLVRIRGLAEAKQPITDPEWETVYATLARAKSQRAFAEMRSEERGKRITLTPDSFKIPSQLSTPLPFLDLSTPRWLSTWQARLDWQDVLQSRVDQGVSLAEGLRSAVSAVEEATLPALHGALVEASDAVGVNPTEKAEWITARLLIDARAGGCQTTTRVARKPLETLQTLIVDLRTGQFKQLTTSPLSLVSDQFDEEWRWVGSYATWRWAMFVFLYPENISQPSLLKDKTPAFENLIKNTRSLRSNPKTACLEAEAYSDYFADVCSLAIEATCQASTVMHAGGGVRPRPARAAVHVLHVRSGLQRQGLLVGL